MFDETYVYIFISFILASGGGGGGVSYASSIIYYLFIRSAMSKITGSWGIG